MIEMAAHGPPELARCELEIRDRYIVALTVSPQMDRDEVFTMDDVFTMWDWKSGECVLVSVSYHTLLSLSYTIAPSVKLTSAPTHFSIRAPPY